MLNFSGDSILAVLPEQLDERPVAADGSGFRVVGGGGRWQQRRQRSRR